MKIKYEVYYNILNSQFLKLKKLVDSKQIGIKEWFIPQISEHWPKNNPGRFIFNKDWLRRPGVESILMPNDGIVHEWITSIDEVRIRIGKLNGRTHRLSVSNNRNSFNFKSLDGIIYELNSISKKSEYSYLQYHWWPKHLIVNLFKWFSSVIYKIFNEGIAINIKIIIGEIVQIISIKWPWRRNRLVILLKDNEIIENKIINVIKIKIIIVKSWKKIINSEEGELAFWSEINQVLIFNKRLNKFFIYRV